MKNVDPATVEDFGLEWQSYDQSSMPSGELEALFNQYFSCFPWAAISPTSVGFDLGCGSGRWAQFMAPKVNQLHCVDASGTALDVARKNLRKHLNVQFHQASAGELPFANGAMDFGFSLGVLHHVPDTLGALRECARVLRPGAPMQLYLYYRFDNKPTWFANLWVVSDIFRKLISRMPFRVKHFISLVIALLVYWPLSRIARVCENAGLDVSNYPLASYRSHRLYTLKTDALDRFGTRLEQRFTQQEIVQMLETCGFEDIVFRTEGPPYWCVSGRRGKS